MSKATTPRAEGQRPPRRAWLPPRLTRIDAADAENGRLVGPEAVLLLS